MKDEFFNYDAIGLADLIREGEITPLELLEITIERIERVNPRINAVVHKLCDQARVEAKQWPSGGKSKPIDGTIFAGVPFLLKNLLAEYEGTPLDEGSRAIRGYISKLDSELVRRQRAGGLIILGKTNTPEFGLLPTTEPILYGPTRNPWNPALTAGGSSGGSAAAVAAGIVPLAHGNDGGGSIRIPASCCGLFGLKPTRGRNPLGPLFGDLGHGLTHEHGLTRTVRDSAALLDLTSGPDLGDAFASPAKERPFVEEVGRDPGCLKIGFLTSLPEGWDLEPSLHPDCLEAVTDAARLCEGLGHKVEEVRADLLASPHIAVTFGRVFSCLAGYFVAYWEKELGRKISQEELEPVTWSVYQAGRKRTGADYLVALEGIQHFSRKIAQWYHDGDYDLILSPTMRIPPTPIGAFHWSPEDRGKWLEVTNAFVAFTRVQNMTGQPAMSMPLFWNEGNIPIGVQFAGRFGDEATLFRLAGQLEEARPWARKTPAIHCSTLNKKTED